MSKDVEAKEYVRRAQAGDQAAHEWLYEKYIRFVGSEARKFSSGFPNLAEDFRSIALVGYLKGIKTFKFEQNVLVLTYLSTCIQNEMRMYLRRLSKEKGTRNLEDIVAQDENEHELTLLEVLRDEAVVGADHMIEQENIVTVLALMLIWRGGRHAALLFEQLAEGRTQKDAAARNGDISQSYVSRLVRKFKKFCRHYTAKEEMRSMRSTREKVEHLRPRILDLLRNGSSFQETAATILNPPKEETPMAKVCSITGCDRKHSAKGYCASHYVKYVQKAKNKGEEPPVHHETAPKNPVQNTAQQQENKEPEIVVSLPEKSLELSQDSMYLALTVSQNGVSAGALLTRLKQLEAVINLLDVHTFDFSIQIRRVGDAQKDGDE